MNHTLLFFLTFSCSGCIVLPIPHQRIHEYGVKGELIDEQGNPIPKAIVRGTQDLYPDFAISDINGNFTLPVNRGWHGGILIGPISLSILPGLDLTNEGRVITIAPQNKPPCAVIISGKREDDMIDAGKITIPPQSSHANQSLE